jgi:hypothetical protein
MFARAGAGASQGRGRNNSNQKWRPPKKGASPLFRDNAFLFLELFHKKRRKQKLFKSGSLQGGFLPHFFQEKPPCNFARAYLFMINETDFSRVRLSCAPDLPRSFYLFYLFFYLSCGVVCSGRAPMRNVLSEGHTHTLSQSLAPPWGTGGGKSPRGDNSPRRGEIDGGSRQ